MLEAECSTAGSPLELFRGETKEKPEKQRAIQSLLTRRAGQEKPEPTNLIELTLADPTKRTEAVIMRLLNAAIVAPKRSEEYLRKNARKLLAYIARHGEIGIPKDECELIFLSELTADEEEMDAADIEIPEASGRRKRKRTTRQFRSCEGCGKRFLARRANQRFHDRNCQDRTAVRRHRQSGCNGIAVQTPLEPA
jgi:hypothetical protein